MLVKHCYLSVKSVWLQVTNVTRSLFDFARKDMESPEVQIGHVLILDFGGQQSKEKVCLPRGPRNMQIDQMLAN